MRFHAYIKCSKYGSGFLRLNKTPSIYYSFQTVPEINQFFFLPHWCFFLHILSLKSYHFTIYFVLNANLPQRIHPSVSHVKPERKKISENPDSTRHWLDKHWTKIHETSEFTLILALCYVTMDKPFILCRSHSSYLISWLWTQMVMGICWADNLIIKLKRNWKVLGDLGIKEEKANLDALHVFI